MRVDDAGGYKNKMVTIRMESADKHGAVTCRYLSAWSMSRAPTMSPGVTLSRVVGSARLSAVRWGALALDMRVGAALPMGAALGAALLLFTLSAVPKRRGAAVAPALPAARVFALRISTSAFSPACSINADCISHRADAPQMKAHHPHHLTTPEQRRHEPRRMACSGSFSGSFSCFHRPCTCGTYTIQSRSGGSTHPRSARARRDHCVL